MNTHLNRMLFSRAFVKVSTCVMISASCLPMAIHAESNLDEIMEALKPYLV